MVAAKQKRLFEVRADRMDGGLNLNTDRLLKPDQIAKGIALRFERGSGLMTGPGYRPMATIVAGASGDGCLEASVTKATFWVKVGTKIQYSHNVNVENATFYDTGVTVTASQRTGFAEGPDGDVFAGNQTDSGIRFATATLNTLATFGDITLDVGTIYIGKFAASGTVYVRGNAITYSGKNAGAGTLTGVAGIQAGGHPAGELVVQSSNPSTWTQKGNILAVLKMGTFSPYLLVSGILANPSQVTWSGPYSAANPQYFYDLSGSNGSGKDFMPATVNGIIVGTAATYVIMDRGVSKITDIATSTGSLLFQYINNKYGAYNPGCVVEMDGIACFMGQRRIMPILLSLTNTGASAPQFDEEFDAPLRPWNLSHDDADQQARAFLKWDPTNKILKAGAIINGALQVQIYDRHFGKYLGYEQRNVGASSMFKGNSFFLHGDNGKVYLDDYGRTNDGAPISHIFSTGRIEDDRGRKWMKGYKFNHQGWMTHGTTYTLRIYVNGSETPSLTRDFDDSLIVENTGRSIGLRGIGLSVPGGSSDEGITVFQFVNPLLIRGINGEDFRFEWEVSGDGAFLLLNTWYFSAYVPAKGPRSDN